MNDIELIKKILSLVSYEGNDQCEGRYYWGHDTSMDADEIEERALNILYEYAGVKVSDTFARDSVLKKDALDAIDGMESKQ